MTHTAVSFGGTALGANELALIRECVSTFPRLSRFELAATVCEWLGWQRPNGRLKTRECRDLLEQLDERGWLELPALRATGRPRGATTVVPQTSQGAAQTPVTGPLRAPAHPPATGATAGRAGLLARTD